FSSRRRHTRFSRDWSSDVCSSDLAAAIPIVRALRESLSGDEVRSVRGVLNGTTTYVLSRLEHGGSFDEAVLEAQRAGYAEADPEIGRASCRERVWMWGVGVWGEKK